MLFTIILPFLLQNPVTTESYTLSLHDALPISERDRENDAPLDGFDEECKEPTLRHHPERHRYSEVSDQEVRAEICAGDRKSTRLNSSHLGISYAVFCLKKKNIKK